MDKKGLSERDICTKFITPNVVAAGWSLDTQIREEVGFTDGRIYVRGKLHTRGARKRADYILYYKPNIPIAVIEAKDNTYTVGAGIQQALSYAASLDVPFVFSSNGDGFLFHDKTVSSGAIETKLALDAFPSPAQLWSKYKTFKGITDAAERVVVQDYYADGSNRTPRYYQQIAINRTVEAIARNEDSNRYLLVMATGTGKTYTAFQIIYRLWKSGRKKRVLFLADRTALIDQTVRGDFRHFKEAMTVIKHKEMDPAYNIYLALYQGLSDNNDRSKDAYKQFSPDFFDLVVVDECHRGSAREDSKWREILEYFQGATHLGLTATPKETEEISSTEYFGDPIYTYSLKQGIDDGFLAPYKVIKVTLDIDAEGWRPPAGFKDKDGKPVEDRIYNRTDFDKHIIVEGRRQLVAQKITEFLKGSDRFSKGLDPRFLLHFLKSDYGREAITRNAVGAVRKRLYYSGLAKIEFAIPNIERQQAFVSRIDHIQQAIRFIRDDNSDRHELPKLKQAILQEAIRGKLTADWRASNLDVEPASQLLRRVEVEKNRLIATKKLRPEKKPLPKIKPDEVPFKLPTGWEWCHLQALSNDIHYGLSASADPTSTDTRLLRITDIQDDRVDWVLVPGCRCSDKERQKYLLKKGDILIARTGGTVGKSYLVETLPVQSIFASYLVRVIPSSIKLAPFVKLYLGSPWYWAQIVDAARGAQPNVSGSKLKQLLVPLPPLAEQAAIVERVEVLMQCCGALEAEVEQARTHAAQLLQAILKEAFAPASAASSPVLLPVGIEQPLLAT